VAQTEIRAQRVVGDVERNADSVERRRWFRILARAGLGARSVIYFLITYLTADIALHGGSPVPADSNGALKEIAREPAGPVILFVVAIGLLGYALWRLVSAVAAADLRENAWAKRLGLAACGAVYLVLCAQAIALAVGSGHTNSASSNPSPVAATVLRWPGGPLYVGLCAAGFVGGGLALLIWGWVHDYARMLDRSRMTRRIFDIARAAGIIGDTVRGLLIGLIGVYLVASTVTDNPSKVKGLDQALQALAHKPFGAWLLSVAAAGLFSFGVYSVFEARYRRI
jgi:Domain of Unknown Function (DUF1206)